MKNTCLALLFCASAGAANAATQPPAFRSRAAAPNARPAAVTAPAMTGTWTGKLLIPGRTLVVDLTVTESNGHLTGVLNVPLTRLNNRTMTVTQRRDTLRFFDPLSEIRYECAAVSGKETLVGRWQQPGFTAVLAMSRAVPVRTRQDSKWKGGEIENNRPVGVWDYYQPGPDGRRQLAQTYDHTAGRLVFSRPTGQGYEAEVSPGTWKFTVLTQEPWFVGGNDALAPYLAGVRYPIAAQKASVEGKVTVSFVVDTLGNISGHRVVRGLGAGCDEEALRVARFIPSTWTPARVGKKAVPVVNYISFAFRVQ